jgi:parallel beta-helix repeat protein
MFGEASGHGSKKDHYSCIDLHDRYATQRSCCIWVEQGGKSSVHNLTRKISRINAKNRFKSKLIRFLILTSTWQAPLIINYERMATFVGKKLQRSYRLVNGKVGKTFVVLILLLISLFLMVNASGGTREQAVHAQVLPSTSTQTLSVPPAVEWQKTFPDAGDTANCIIQTGDGGYAVVGEGNSKSGNPRGFLFKLDSSGNMQWNKSYSTGNLLAVVQTRDGGYALDGVSVLIKTDSKGNVQWNKTFSDEYVASMVQTSDGGYALAGYATTAQVQNGRYESDFWLAKVNSAGTLLWTKTFGRTGDTEASSVIQASDGGYALAGKSNAYSDAGEYDFMLVKTDSSGNQQWLKTFGGAGGDSEANSVIQISDGSYVLAGDTTAYGLGGYDAWLVKTDPLGNLTWTRTYGGTGELLYLNETLPTVFGSNGSGYDYAYSLIQTSDGGLAFVGSSEYEPGAGTAYTVVWLVKTDSAGNTQWNETFGGPFQSWAGNSLIETNDGAFAIAGYEQEPGFPWLGNYYVVKTKPTLPPPSTSPSPSPPPSTSPSPAPILAFPSTTISADGDVNPSTALIQRNGNVYEFTGNLNGPLVVNTDNIVIDGAGYSLQGNGTAGELFIRMSQTAINLTDRTNVTIRNLQIYSYNYGIYLDNSTNATISGNNITQNEYGVFEITSAFAAISGNNITQNNYGILVTAPSLNNKISSNNIGASRSFGITLNQSDGNVIFDNNISSSGIDLESGSNNLIAGNIMYSDFYGVYMNGENGSIIAANNFTACSFGINSHGATSGNLFYMNDFNNTHTNEFQGNAKNSWDNGTIGNYWSDYLTRYPNATEIDSSGIGDTPYAVIYGYIPNSLGPLFDPNTPNPNNVDHYPLLAPISSASAAALAQALVLTHSWSSTPTQSPSTNLILFASLALVAVVIVLMAVVVLKCRKKQAQATLSAPS